MSAKSNRRKHPRVEGEGVTGHVKHEGELLLGLPVENISQGGMLLRCSEPLPVGNQVVLEVTRPGMKSLKLVGRVLSAAPLKKAKSGGTWGVSIRFNPMGEDLTQRLSDLVTALYQGRPAAPGTGAVRVALSPPHAPQKPPPPRPDFDFDFGNTLPLAEDEASEAVVGKAAVAGGQFEAPPSRGEFDFDFQEPLAASVQEPAPGPAPEPPAVTVKLTADVRSEPASTDVLLELLGERERELKQLKDELARKNAELEKLRRAVLELRHRNKPVL